MVDWVVQALTLLVMMIFTPVMIFSATGLRVRFPADALLLCKYHYYELVAENHLKESSKYPKH